MSPAGPTGWGRGGPGRTASGGRPALYDARATPTTGPRPKPAATTGSDHDVAGEERASIPAADPAGPPAARSLAGVDRRHRRSDARGAGHPRGHGLHKDRRDA